MRTAAALAPFPSCPAFLAAVRAEADAEVQPWGLPAGMGVAGPVAVDGPMRMATAAGAAAAPSAGAAGGAATDTAAPAFSTTNDQEAGVDELDAVKTDGHVLVALEGNQIHVLRVGRAPAALGALPLPPAGAATGLFLVGADAVVIGGSWSQGGPETTVAVVSLADPAHPALARTFSVDGSFVAARLVGTSVKLVVTFSPRIPLPDTGSVAANRAAIERAPLEDWLPAVTDAAGRRSVVPCASVAHTAEADGVGTVSVISFDPSDATPGPPVTVVGNAGSVYASATALYVATTAFSTQQAIGQGVPVADARTTIHEFDITDPAKASYVGSGAVPGVLLNQYSLSEYAGVLRVATTTGVPTPPPGEGVAPPPADGSQSMVTVLRPTAGALVPVGQLGGLGRGERIYGVRFVDALGYVVTYRQLDPLFVVDLSDPAHPVLRGSLELTGYSAYLHPVGGGRLLGVGAASDAQAHRTGVQVSLFDVGRPDNPALIARDVLPEASAPVENDPHAFLWWAPSSLAIVPIQQWQQPVAGPSSTGGFDGAIAFRVGAAGLTEVGRVSHDGRAAASTGEAGGGTAGSATPPPGGGAPAPPVRGPESAFAPIERALVVGGTLYTVSPAGVLASDLSTFADVGWVPFQ